MEVFELKINMESPKNSAFNQMNTALCFVPYRSKIHTFFATPKKIQIGMHCPRMFSIICYCTTLLLLTPIRE